MGREGPPRPSRARTSHLRRVARLLRRSEGFTERKTTEQRPHVRLLRSAGSNPRWKAGAASAWFDGAAGRRSVLGPIGADDRAQQERRIGGRHHEAMCVAGEARPRRTDGRAADGGNRRGNAAGPPDRTTKKNKREDNEVRFFEGRRTTTKTTMHGC